MNAYALLSFLLGWVIGYVIFYFRFQHKDTINHLRTNLKETNKEFQIVQADLEEYSAQNTILKEELTKLLEKNDDLTDIVTELSKYYVHIKKASEKSTELSKYLQEPSPEVEEKIHHRSTKKEEEKSEKKFF